jgi:diadenosine tetraphosphate (Ap4A) HIT family hydrolase
MMMMKFPKDHSECIFCELPNDRIITKDKYWRVIRDGFPVTEGHTLFILNRHEPDYFNIDKLEADQLQFMLFREKINLRRADKSISGFNIGINVGEDAGQTVFHVHVHLIPRRKGDVENPRGGIRHLIPNKGNY